MKYKTRLADITDKSALINIYNTVFADPPEIVSAFFDTFFLPELTVAATVDGTVAASGYLLYPGNLKYPKGSCAKCAVIYALATLPEFRAQGIGKTLTQELVKLAQNTGFDAVVLRPANDSLFTFYSKSAQFLDAFYTAEHTFNFSTSEIYNSRNVAPISANEYRAERQKLLQGTLYIDFNERALEYQNKLGMLTGNGGLVSITPHGGSVSLAATELNRNTLIVKELLTNDINAAALDLARFYGVTRVLTRTPAKTGSDALRRFGMLLTLRKPDEPNTDTGWMGLAFD